MYTFRSYALILCLFLLTTGNCRHVEIMPKQTPLKLFQSKSDNCTNISMSSDELQMILDHSLDEKTKELNDYVDIKIELLNFKVINTDGNISKINKTKICRLHAKLLNPNLVKDRLDPTSVQYQLPSDKVSARTDVVKTEQVLLPTLNEAENGVNFTKTTTESRLVKSNDTAFLVPSAKVGPDFVTDNAVKTTENTLRMKKSVKETTPGQQEHGTQKRPTKQDEQLRQKCLILRSMSLGLPRECTKTLSVWT